MDDNQQRRVYGESVDRSVELNERDPFVRWEVADVQFGEAHTDFIIRHNLQVGNPHVVHYRVIRQYTPGSVYEPVATDAKKWTTDYIVLRSDTTNWTGRILLGVPRNLKLFAKETFDIPDDFVPVQPPEAVVSNLGILVTFDNLQGEVLTTGEKTRFSVPFDCTITGWTLLSADPATPPITGSIVVNLYKDTYANFYPTGADAITGSAKPTITTATKATSTTLTGWTTTITAGDVITAVIDSVSDFTKVTLTLALTTEL